MKKIISKGYKGIAYIAIIITFILVNFFNISETISKKGIYILLLGMVYMLIVIIINKFIINKLKANYIKVIIGILLFVFLILEILSVYYFRVEYNWDFKWIMDTAKQVVDIGCMEPSNLKYFKVFPNNIPILGIVIISMRLFFNNEIGAYILNIMAVWISAILGVIVAYKIKDEKLALNTILLMILCCPFYLYSPIIYTDTMAVMFPVLTLLLWILFKENKQKENRKKQYICWILMTICSIIAFWIKPVAAIILIAIIIDSIFTYGKNLKFIIITCIIFILMNLVYNNVITKFVIKDVKNNDIVYPYTHWVMMGLNKPKDQGGTSVGWGGYSYEDSVLTETQPTYDEKVQVNLKIIKERILDFGLKGYIEFLKNKFIYVWEDPTFYVLEQIGWGTLNTYSLPYKYVIGVKSEQVFIPYTSIYYTMLVFLILIGIIYDIRKAKDQNIRIIGISIVGIAIFLLIWEARSRYIYFLIPIFCIMAANGARALSQIKYKGNKKE